MRTIFPSEIPEDYHYYRSHSKAYFDYVMRSEWSHAVRIEEGWDYAYVHHYFFWLFSIACFEKCDIEPTRELLAKYGMKRGIVFWSAWRREKSRGMWWYNLGYIFSYLYHHSTRSAFSVLDTPEYWKKWSSSARGHRNRIVREIESGNIRIDADTSFEKFLEVYRRTKVPHKWKRYFIWRQKYLSEKHSANIRIYTASIHWEILAGAVFLDDAPTSTYLIAFQDDRAKPHHLWLAILDRWFSLSQKLGYKYLDLDHMRDSLDPLGYAGYTRFKSEIADYDIFFRKLWMKIFV